MTAFQGTAVVIGATSLIGAAVVVALATDGCRELVLLEDSRQDSGRLNELRGRLAETHAAVATLTLSCDLQDMAAIESALQTAAAKFGSISYCINCCARSDPRVGNTLEISPADFKATLEANQKSTWLALRSQISLFLRQEHPSDSTPYRGTIVNVCPVQGLGSQPGLPGYTAAGWGVIGMSKTVALDHIKSNIRINCVCHGELDLFSKASAASGVAVTRPEEVAAAVSFLASDRSSGINGVTLPVDGGWSLSHY